MNLLAGRRLNSARCQLCAKNDPFKQWYSNCRSSQATSWRVLRRSKHSFSGSTTLRHCFRGIFVTQIHSMQMLHGSSLSQVSCARELCWLPSRGPRSSFAINCCCKSAPSLQPLACAMLLLAFWKTCSVLTLTFCITPCTVWIQSLILLSESLIYWQPAQSLLSHLPFATDAMTTHGHQFANVQKCHYAAPLAPSLETRSSSPANQFLSDPEDLHGHIQSISLPAKPVIVEAFPPFFTTNRVISARPSHELQGAYCIHKKCSEFSETLFNLPQGAPSKP